MTVATRDEEAVGSSSAHAVVKVPHVPRRWRQRVDVIGASAVALAAAGLAGTIVFLRPTPAAMPQTVSVPPMRDQWYMDARPPSAEQSAVVPSSVVGDRWWEDGPSGLAPSVTGAPPRDQWYADPAAQPTNPDPSTPARDRWYLDHP
jgi:hypothetical protein